MAFGVAKNGMRMYVPSWQLEPGSGRKAANRKVVEGYMSNLSSLGGTLFGATTDYSAGLVNLTAQMTTARLQSEFSKKLEQAKAGLDVIV